MSLPRIVVIGGAGAMGRIAVKDLLENASSQFEVVVADRDLAAAKKLGVTAKRIDVTDAPATRKLLAGSFGVICAVHHHFNLHVMKAALGAGVHYCDLGGLFHMTRKQLKLDAAFRKRGLLALLGIGAAPGIVNVLARAGAEGLDSVEAIDIAVGGIDRTPNRPVSTLGTSYSLETVLDEATLPAAVFRDGKLSFVEPMSGTVEVSFPHPVGVKRPSFTLHSELATLPQSFKGVRQVTFRIAFSEELDAKLRFLRVLGLSETRPLKVGKNSVSPRQVLHALLRQVPKVAAGDAVPDEYEVLRVVVRGRRDGQGVEETLDCHTPGIREWKMGVDVDTGCPPSIAMQMIERGEISARGALPPERAIPPKPFFAELERRGMKVRRNVRSIKP